MKPTFKKLSRSFIILFASLISITACKKDKSLAPTLPTLSTNSISEITTTSATSGGSITNNGGAAVIQSGVCWSTSTNPAINNNPNKTIDIANANGSFTSSITGLSNSTTYYIRAYATNSAGTAYGNEQEFTTGTEITLPALTTNDITVFTSTTATLAGNISSNGGSAITQVGVFWSTSEEPNVAGDKISITDNVPQSGNFSGDLSNLTPNTTYYVQAYAVNSVGTTYGAVKNFTTGINLPVLSTNAVSNITAASATCGGNISDNGGGTISERGICWSTNPGPTTSNTHITYNEDKADFSIVLDNLNPNTTYFIRAYAINEAGTAYGNEENFTTGITIPTLSTDINAVGQTSATCGGTISTNGGSLITERGIYWSTNPNPTILDNQVISLNAVQSGSFDCFLNNLTLGVTYYVRAYAKNDAGTAYGAEQSFTTGAQ